jgi:hypothetical protein
MLMTRVSRYLLAEIEANLLQSYPDACGGVQYHLRVIRSPDSGIK